MLLTLVGAALRLQGLGSLGLTHFDEGIYATAALWIYSPTGLAAYPPSAIAYAPPGYSILVGIFDFLTGGPSDVSALAVSVIAGTLTIPVVAWLGRRTFGPGAGWTSAAFATFSGPHLAFSRMGLTDATFLLAWLLAIGLGGRFAEQPRAGRAIAFGLAVGLAQLLKYNGWLAGVVVVAGASLHAVRLGDDRRRFFSWGTLAVGVAALVYLPWYRFIEAHGGYSQLLAHQKSYILGWRAWPSDVRTQVAQSFALSPLALGCTAWIVAGLGGIIGVGRVANSGKFSGSGRSWAIPGLIGLAGLSLAVPGVVWLFGLASLPGLFPSGPPSRRILGAWLLVLAVLTPLYHPYARLWLPIEAAGWIWLGGILQWRETGAEWFRSRTSKVWAGVVVIAGVGWVGTITSRTIPGLLGPTDDLRLVIQQRILPKLQSAEVSRVLGLVRPPVTYYLGGRVPFSPMPDLSTLRKNRRPGDWILLDEGQIDLRSHRDGSLPIPMGPASVFEFRPAGPTLLDEDLEATRRGMGRVFRLWLIPPALHGDRGA